MQSHPVCAKRQRTIWDKTTQLHTISVLHQSIPTKASNLGNCILSLLRAFDGIYLFISVPFIMMIMIYEGERNSCDTLRL